MAKNICIGWSRCCRADSASNGVRAILEQPVPSQNSIRSRNLGRYRPQRGPKTRSKFEFLFGRENSLFFAEASCHMLSSVDCITTTSESEFSVHTGRRPKILDEAARAV